MIQRVCINGSNVRYQLSVNSNTTGNLSTSSNASEIEDVLNELPAVLEVGKVGVFLERQSELCCLSIIFLSQAESVPTVAVATDVDYEITVVQESAFHDYTLGFGSRNTEHLPPQIDASDLESNITELFSTECSRSLSGSVFFADTYENAVSRYNNPIRDNSVEPACGRYSVKNPRHLYRAGQSVNELTGEVYNLLTLGANPSRMQYRYVSQFHSFQKRFLAF